MKLNTKIILYFINKITKVDLNKNVNKVKNVNILKTVLYNHLNLNISCNFVCLFQPERSYTSEKK